MPVDPKQSRQLVATAVLKQVPLGQLGGFINNLPGVQASGHVCGVGCQGAHNPIDEFGHSGLTQEHLSAAVADKAAFKAELVQQATAATQKLGK